MESDRKAMMRGGLEQALDLLWSEGDAFAKCVDAGRNSLLRRCRDELVDDLADVMRATVALVGGKRVQGKQRRYDPHCRALAELARDLHQAKLVLRIEPVARLDLDRRAAAAHQRPEPATALVKQLLVRSRHGALHRRGNSAAGLRDLLVACTGAAHRVLVRACSAEDEMRVAIDETGRDPRASERNDFLGAKTCELGPLADAHDLAVGDPDCPVLDRAERVTGTGPLEGRDIAVDEQPVPHASA